MLETDYHDITIHGLTPQQIYLLARYFEENEGRRPEEIEQWLAEGLTVQDLMPALWALADG